MTECTQPDQDKSFLEMVIGLCKSHYGTCPYGCDKNFSPNCIKNIADIMCAPVIEVITQGGEYKITH